MFDFNRLVFCFSDYSVDRYLQIWCFFNNNMSDCSHLCITELNHKLTWHQWHSWCYSMTLLAQFVSPLFWFNCLTAYIKQTPYPVRNCQVAETDSKYWFYRLIKKDICKFQFSRIIVLFHLILKPNVCEVGINLFERDSCRKFIGIKELVW